MQTLLSLDEKIFFFINHTLVNSILDVAMPFITNLDNWEIPIVLIVLLLLVKGGKRGRVAIFLLIPVLIASDQVAAFVLKPGIGRVRPCHALENVRLLVGCGGKYAFPSNHATNVAGFAFVFSMFYRKYWALFWSIALAIGFSRIYVGVHYPLDVIGGLILGSMFAYVVYNLYLLVATKYPVINLNVNRDQLENKNSFEEMGRKNKTREK